MTNKQLQELLKQLPDDYTVLTEHYGSLNEEPKGFLFDVNAQGVYVNHIQKEIKVHTDPFVYEKKNKILGKKAAMLYEFYQQRKRTITEIIKPRDLGYIATPTATPITPENIDNMSDEDIIRNIDLNAIGEA